MHLVKNPGGVVYSISLATTLNKGGVGEVIRLMSAGVEILPHNECILDLAELAKHGDETVIGAQIRARQLFLHLVEKAEGSSQITPATKCMNADIVAPGIKSEAFLVPEFVKHLLELRLHVGFSEGNEQLIESNGIGIGIKSSMIVIE